MKVLLFANTDWYLFNFRLLLIEDLIRKGWDVTLVSPSGVYVQQLRERGLQHIALNFSSGSTNPFVELRLFLRVLRAYARIRPNIIHHHTIKPVLYGSLAALILRIPYVNSITGLGHLFTTDSLRSRLFRPIVLNAYSLLFRSHLCHVVFQNSSQMNSFIAEGVARPNASTLIKGSGVSGDQFHPSMRIDHDIIRVLFASRLLREKGIGEFIHAARELGSDGSVVFTIAGDIYPDNPTSLTSQEVDELSGIPGIEYLGHVDDMARLLAETDLAVLPSYAEGAPKIVIEAMAMGLPVVVSDIPGCRDMVEDGENGILVPVADEVALTAAIRRLLADSELRRTMGDKSRSIFESGFDTRRINRETVAVYTALVRTRSAPID
jgi:glycosyltransferase involved in cell wall biosynthesis